MPVNFWRRLIIKLRSFNTLGHYAYLNVWHLGSDCLVELETFDSLSANHSFEFLKSLLYCLWIKVVITQVFCTFKNRTNSFTRAILNTNKAQFFLLSACFEHAFYAVPPCLHSKRIRSLLHICQTLIEHRIPIPKVLLVDSFELARAILGTLQDYLQQGLSLVAVVLCWQRLNQQASLLWFIKLMQVAHYILSHLPQLSKVLLLLGFRTVDDLIGNRDGKFDIRRLQCILSLIWDQHTLGHIQTQLLKLLLIQQLLDRD